MRAVDMDAEVLIVGAGMAGLMAGRTLKQRGKSVIVVEKSRGVGGRLATRRIENAVFDHGAQFFTVRDERFQVWVDEWMRQGVVEVWSRGFAKPGEGTIEDGHPRYRSLPGMTGIAKWLAEGLDVRLQNHLKSVSPMEDGWQAASQDGQIVTGQSLILTAPVPQSLALLEAGGVSMSQKVRLALEGIRYEPCIAALALLEGPSRIPPPGGMQFKTGPIRWMADNARKGLSPGAPGVTIHAAFEYSRRHFEADPDLIAAELLEAAGPWLGSTVRGFQVHKWRYSLPVKNFPDRTLAIPARNPLILAGDAFGEPRVEGAALSGLAAAEGIL